MTGSAARSAGWIRPEVSLPHGVHVVVAIRSGDPAASPGTRGFSVGAHCGDDPAAVARDRAGLRAVLGLPSEPCWLRQVHGTGVVEAAAPLCAEPEADAIVTRAANVVLAIQTADCLPVVFWSDDGQELAAAHAGWRGLAAGVLETTLAAMHAPATTVEAWLGPAIAAGSYEVGEEVRQAFVASDSDAATAFVHTRPGHWHCDLYALARHRLHTAGVTRVSGGDRDTFTDARLHSFRRDGAASGRMATLAWRDA